LRFKRSRWLWFALAGVLLLALGTYSLLAKPAPQIEYGINLLKNGDFESVSGEGLPDDWLPDAYLSIYGVSDFEVSDGQSGRGITIRNNDANDARFVQTVQVQPNTLYELSGYVKAKALDGRGANLSIMQVSAVSDSLTDTLDAWQKLLVYGRTGSQQRELTVYARLGGYSADSRGEASFDGLRLVALQEAPAGAFVESWEPWDLGASQADNEPEASPKAFWPWLLVISALYIAYVRFASRRSERHALEDLRAQGKPVWDKDILLLLLLAAVTRIVMAALIPGYGVDIGCFTGWANEMYRVGPTQFYVTEGFSDYPPGYMLVLWPLGLLGSLMGTGATGFMVKLPPILTDLASIALLYAFASKHLNRRSALTLAAVYALSPLVYATGAAWGQVDSLPALLLMLIILLAFKGKWSWALPLYVLAVLMKPQALMFGPLGLVALIVDLVFYRDKGKVRSVLFGCGGAVLTALAVILPFSVNQDGFDWLIKLYAGTMNYYGYATVNATNLYFLFALNWIPIEQGAPLLLRLLGAVCLILPTLTYLFGSQLRVGLIRVSRLETILLSAALLPVLAVAVLPLSLQLTGTLLMAAAFLLLTIRYIIARDIKNLPLLGAVMLILFCVLGVMMHERYLFTAVLLLMMAYVLRRDRKILWLFCALSVVVFLNVSIVLDRGIRIGGVEGHLSAPSFNIVSESGWLEYANAAASVLIAGFALYVGLSQSDQLRSLRLVAPSKAEALDREGKPNVSADPAEIRILSFQSKPHVGFRDWLIILVVTGLYALIALTNLGSLKAPQKGYTFTQLDEEVIFDLGSVRDFYLLHYGGIHWRDSDYIAQSSIDMVNWLGGPAQMRPGDSGDCFSWKYQKESIVNGDETTFSGANLLHHGRYLKITAPTVGLTLMEVIVRDAQTKETLPLTMITGSAAALIDEQDTLEGEPSWYNSMYFDEIYHARTAYEQLNAIRGQEPSQIYETSHPPLGKVFMTAAIAVFGMVPYGWRFAGAAAGVLMLPGMYLLAKLLTKRKSLGLLAMLLLAFDCMHFAQTRIATIDSFVTLFIIWSYYFMFCYALSDDYAKPWVKTLPNLAFSGLFMGLGIASKWTGIYAGAGLAILFFWTLWRRMREGKAAERLLARGDKADGERAAVLQVAAAQWQKRILYTLLACLLFFIAIPLLIYYLAFLPVFMQTPGGLTVKKVMDANKSMLSYHSTPGLGMNHFFYSPWYEWPLSLKPMWFYSGSKDGNTGSTIMTLGNPAVWLGGLAALVTMIGMWFKQRLRTRPLRISSHSLHDDMRPGLLVISFLAQYLPWILVPRGTYIYHYFPAVPFIILCTVLALYYCGLRRQKLARLIAISFTVMAGLLFIAFFPYVSGLRVSKAWLDAMQWFPNWLYY